MFAENRPGPTANSVWSGSCPSVQAAQPTRDAMAATSPLNSSPPLCCRHLRYLPADALAKHMETLLRFVTSDYFDSYIDAAAGAADMQGTGSGGGRRRSLGSSMLLSPASQCTASLEDASQAAGAAGLMLKCAALKALASACVPDSDAQDAPVEVLRVVVRLAEFLEG